MPDFIESTIELLQDGRISTRPEQFIAANISEVIKYMGLALFAHGNKGRKASTIEYIKRTIIDNHLVDALYSREYLFLIKEIRRNAQRKKVSEGIVETWYENYTEIIRKMIESDSGRVMDVICSSLEQAPGEDSESAKSGNYFLLLLRSSDSHYMVDVFASFFVMEEKSLVRWLHFLKKAEVVSLTIGMIARRQAEGREYQNLSKVLYVLVSFTGTIIRRCPDAAELQVAPFYFYSEVDAQAPFLLQTLFSEAEYFNRASVLEVLKALLYKAESMDNMRAELIEHLGRFISPEHASGGHPLALIQQRSAEDASVLKVSALVELVSRSIKFKNASMRDALLGARFVEEVLEYNGAVPLASTLSQAILYLVKELVATDRAFYCDVLISLCRFIYRFAFRIQRNFFSLSYTEFAPHHSINDNFTPILKEIAGLKEVCSFESRTYSSRSGRQPSNPGGSGDAKERDTGNRFFTIGKENASYKIAKELAFMESEEWEWYLSVLGEYEKRMGLEYVRGPRERLVEVNEQFARYLCRYVGQALPQIGSRYYE